MKNFIVRLLFLWVALLGPAYGYAQRAAAEELSYWYAYLLEGLAEDSGIKGYQPMVAVGCASKMKTGLARCSLQQFLEYLWAPQVGPDGKPKNTAYPEGNVGDMSDYKWETADLTAIFNKIFKAGFTDGVRGNRLVRGATEFWPARRQVTVPIASLQGRIAEFSDPAKATKMIAKAKEANTAAYMMRLMDFEKYRIKGGSLNKELGDGRQVATRTLDTGIRGFSFNALDAEATLASFPGLTQADLQAACDRVRVLPKNINHWTALQAGRAALTNGDCALPDVAHITL